MNEEYGEIRIPKQLISKIQERIQDTEFESVDEYATFVLEEVVKEDEEVEEVFSEEDEEKVKQRLRALGYLD